MLANLPVLLKQMPVVAIMRGISPDEIIDAGKTLHSNGINIIEVPLNSPQPFVSVKRLSDSFGDRCLCGAGTVLNETQVDKVFEAGGRLIVAPNTNVRVISRAIELGMIPIPGFSTATEAFTAIEAGATALKLFPASAMGTEFLKSLLAVIPADIAIIATGGVNADNMQQWLSAGAAGLGVGGDLYRPGLSQDALNERAAQLTDAYRTLSNDD